MSNKPTIVADENIPLLDELLADKAEIIRLPGRAMRAQDLQQADALLVRSITQVDKALLQNTPVGFVGTCTIGVDHIDQAYLQENHIAFTSAPGCNALAVVDYVMAALLALNPDLAYWRSKTVGVLGYGQVGSRLCQRLEQIGIAYRVCDPFKTQAKHTLEEVLGCDVISLHVPLTKQGEYATDQLLNQQRLQALQAGTVLINTSRGKVVDNQALLALLQTRKIRAVLDVYQAEPTPSEELLQALDIATAHIAGYSAHGKMRGTLQVVEKLFEHFNWQEKPKNYLADFQQTLQANSLDDAVSLMKKAYDIRQDSQNFLQYYLAVERKKRAEAFDLYRKNYPTRYELGFITVNDAATLLGGDLSALGFIVA